MIVSSVLARCSLPVNKALGIKFSGSNLIFVVLVVQNEDGKMTGDVDGDGNSSNNSLRFVNIFVGKLS